MNNYLIKNARIVNEDQSFIGFVLVRHGIIQAVGEGEPPLPSDYTEEIDAKGRTLIPGVIDDQVHFREPGLTHKATIASESKAAVAGGVTSFMEMPNTIPNAVNIGVLEEKYERAAESSMANYSFYLGASNDNINEIRKLDPKRNCGVKVFMGSSTGNMLVDDPKALAALFAEAPTIIAAHCEDENTIKTNTEHFRGLYGEDIPVIEHLRIRSEEACYRSSSMAAELAAKHNARLHILHISTEKELQLFSKGPVEEKKLTAEVCIHHLWFNDTDYEKKGALIKWNPSVKLKKDQDALFQGLLDDKLDVVATDHAPHTMEEKQNKYFTSPSGGPMVQHSLVAMLEFAHKGKISIERVVEKMCHVPARLFQLDKRGFIRPGYHADLVLLDLDCEWKVARHNILYKCGWSPLEGQEMHARVTHTFVNGKLVYKEGLFNEMIRGERLLFNR